MSTITLKLELHKPTQAKQEMYQQMTAVNTDFANWLLIHPELTKRLVRFSKRIIFKNSLPL
jgi:hypothetical protein